MTVSIFSLAKPPYEQYLYVSYGVSPTGEVQMYVWPGEKRFVGGPTILTYPAKDRDRALKEIKELATLIATTRRILSLAVPVTEPQKL